MSNKGYLIANFGGPRSLEEVEPFLTALLTDKDVIKTALPQSLHNFFFGRLARKRAQVVKHDYTTIGGFSPIWTDTECIAESLRSLLKAPVITFHRYLTATHAATVDAITKSGCDEILVFPMFPQFTYATTGSIARRFATLLPADILNKLRWVKSYATHPSFIQVTVQDIREFLDLRGLPENKVMFLFSAHGLPQTFVDNGDLYAYECRSSFESVMTHFPEAKGILCYQSQFGRGEWLRPYTKEICANIETYAQGRPYCVFIPISFTSDHIETLFEIEQQYMPLIQAKGLYPFRVPALNRRPDWIHAISNILTTSSPCPTSMLISR